MIELSLYQNQDKNYGTQKMCQTWILQINKHEILLYYFFFGLYFFGVCLGLILQSLQILHHDYKVKTYWLDDEGF